MQSLIDLAGSESSKAETTGMRRKEGSYINKSLLTLGAKVALAAFTRLTMFMRFLMVAQRTFHDTA